MSHPGANGLKPWLIQRLTAVYLTLFSVVMFIVLIQSTPLSFTQWKTLFSHPLVNISSGLFFVALLLHLWVGLRDVLIDYVHPTAIRLILLAGILGTLMAMGLWSLKILISLNL